MVAKNGDAIVTRVSPRLSQFSENKDVITIENITADQSEPPHHYDLPSELYHSHAGIHRMQWTNVPSTQGSYIPTQSSASSMNGSVSQISRVYDSATELGNVSQLSPVH